MELGLILLNTLLQEIFDLSQRNNSNRSKLLDNSYCIKSYLYSAGFEYDDSTGAGGAVGT